MKIRYIPIWKRGTSGTRACAALGFAGGLLCCVFTPPFGMYAAGILAVISGILIDDGWIGDQALLFTLVGAMGLLTGMSLLPVDSPNYRAASQIANPTPWQVVLVFPLQLLGYGLGKLWRRLAQPR